MKQSRFSLFFLMTFFVANLFAQQRSVEEALQIANSVQSARRSAASQNGLPRTRMQLYKQSSELMHGKVTTEECFYVFVPSVSGEKGFVIVSGDKRMSEILAYSSTDVFDADKMPPAINVLFDQYEKEYKWLNEKANSNAVKLLDPDAVFKATGRSVEPLLTTEWNQSSPYNNLCPLDGGIRAVTGCVATATAQIMKHYNYPARGKGSVSYTTTTKGLTVNYNFSNIVFDWANMLDVYNSGYNNTQANAVAELMAACGAASQMDYTNSSSGTSIMENMTGLFEYLSYDSDMALAYHDVIPEQVWQNLLMAELDAARPICYAGSHGNSGHCFVLDGYRCDETNYPDYHVNWGWGGICDGYYKTSSLAPSETGIGGGNGSYSEGMQFIRGLQPENGKNDCGGFFYCNSTSLSPSVIKANTGTTMDLTISEFFNNSVTPFNGMLYVKLDLGNGTKTSVFSGTVTDLQPYYGWNTLNLALNIPNTLSPGRYAVKLYCSDDNGETIQPIYVGSGNAELLVTESGSDETIPALDIQVQDLTFTDPIDNGNQLTATYKNTVNLGTSTFTGNISIVVTDLNDEILAVIGDQTKYNLQSGYYNGLEITLNATIPNLPIGQYRLRLAACQDTFKEWTIVRGCRLEESALKEFDLDVYQNLWITENGASTSVNKCPSPTIAFVDGRLVYECSVPSATIHHTLTVKEDEENKVFVIVTAYATCDGYDPSMPTVQTFSFDSTGDMDGDGNVSVSDVTKLVNKILKK